MTEVYTTLYTPVLILVYFTFAILKIVTANFLTPNFYLQK